MRQATRMAFPDATETLPTTTQGFEYNLNKSPTSAGPQASPSVTPSSLTPPTTTVTNTNSDKVSSAPTSGNQRHPSVRNTRGTGNSDGTEKQTTVKAVPPKGLPVSPLNNFTKRRDSD